MKTKGQLTQEKIAKAATHLFAKYGIENTTIGLIATKLKLTQPAIYVHFKDKIDILRACSLTSAAEGRVYIDQHVNMNEDAEKRLHGYIKGNLKWIYEKWEEAYPIVSLYYFGIQAKEIKEIHSQINIAGINRIETHIIHGNYEGKWKVEDTKRKAELIHSMLVGEMMKAFHWPDNRTCESRLKGLWNSIMEILQ